MKQKVLFNVMNHEDLLRCSPRDRIIINGLEAGVIFPGEGNVALFLRVDGKGDIYEMTDEGFEVTYTSDGQIKINDSWHRNRFLDSMKNTYKEMGVID